MKIAKMIKQGALVVATGVLSLALLTGCGGGKGIITVNGDEITRAEYNEMFQKASKNTQFTVTGKDAKDPDSFLNLMTRDRVVNELIAKKLLDQEIEKRKIQVTEEDIKLQKVKITEAVGGEERLKELMKQNDISEKQFEEDVKNEVKVDKLVAGVASSVVSDREVKEYYAKNKAHFNTPDRVRASHILIISNPELIREEVIEKDKKGALSAAQIDEKVSAEVAKRLAVAKEIRAKLDKNPGDFAKLAKEHSEDKGSAVRGGDLGFFTRDMMVKPFSDAAFNLKINTISDIVVSEFGNHIILVTDRSKAGLQPFNKVEPDIRAYLEQSKKVAILQKLFEGLRSSAKITFNDPSFDPETIQKKIREKAAAQMQMEKDMGLEGQLAPVDLEKKDKK